MIKHFIIALFCLCYSLFAPTIASAAPSVTTTPDQPEARDTFYTAKVISILQAGLKDVDGVMQEHQEVKLEITNGSEKGKQIIIDHGGTFAIQKDQKVSVGESVVIAKAAQGDMVQKSDFYYIVDKYRINRLVIIATLFFLLAIYFGRKRGLTSIIGMLFSIVVIFYFIIPHIVSGGNAFLYSIIGSFAILFFSLYFSHGFNRRTTIALISTFAALVIAVAFDWVFVHIAKLSGTGSEEAFYLQFDNANISLQGVLLGGIIIGVLGVLDDVTTAQAAAIEEIHLANPALTFRDLYRRGLSIGREHIASLVNTLVLAYVGASFPLLLLHVTQGTMPIWMIMNSNFISEEIVRTLVGSSVLVIAVPLTTILAAVSYSMSPSTTNTGTYHH